MITAVKQPTSGISTVDALWVLFQSQTKAVHDAFTKRILTERNKTATQQAMVAESLSRALEELVMYPMPTLKAL